MKKTCLFILFTLISFISLTASAQNPTRFPFGVNNSLETGMFANLDIPNPYGYHILFDDFDYFNQKISTTGAGYWNVVTTEGGTSSAEEYVAGTVGSLLSTSIDGGVLDVVNDTDMLDADYIYGATSFTPSVNKNLWFEARFKIRDVTNAILVCGLQIVSASPNAAVNGIYFRSNYNSSTLDLVSVDTTDYLDNNVTVGDGIASGVITLVSNTFTTVGFHYDGNDELAYFVNGVRAGTLSGLYIPTTTPLAPVFGIINGATLIREIMQIDYILAIKER